MVKEIEYNKLYSIRLFAHLTNVNHFFEAKFELKTEDVFMLSSVSSIGVLRNMSEKETGNKFFEKGDYAKAVEWYSKGKQNNTLLDAQAFKTTPQMLLCMPTDP